MKTVIVLRHAKSDWSDTALRDFDRGLNDRGERAAAVMGRWASNQGLSFDGLLASPAKRVVETLSRFCEAYGDSAPPSYDLRLYLANAATISEVLAEAPATASAVLLAAHSPGLEEFILSASGQDARQGLRSEVEVKFPTAAVAILDFAIAEWSDLGDSYKGRATLRAFVRPRDVDASLGPDQR